MKIKKLEELLVQVTKRERTYLKIFEMVEENTFSIDGEDLFNAILKIR